MQCPKCQVDLPDDAKFCGACGEKFAAAAVSGDADEKEKDGAHPVTGEVLNPFEMKPKDFGRALEIACQRSKKKMPAGDPPTNHASLNAAAEAVGLDKLVVEKALHRVSIEKLPADQRRSMGVVLEEDLPPQKRSKLIPLFALMALAALGGGVTLLVLHDPTPEPVAQVKPQRGQIDMGALQAPIDAVAKAAQGCYAAALKKFVASKDRKTLQGEVVLTLRIDLAGKVAVTLSKDELKDAAATACMTAAVADKTWPAATIAPVDVDVPLTFAAK